MLPEKVTVGQLVRSMAGRDKGKYYLVYEVLNETYVRLIDGDKRSLSNPKKKNIRHLEILPVVADSLAEKIRTRERLQDRVVSETIKNLGFGRLDS